VIMCGEMRREMRRDWCVRYVVLYIGWEWRATRSVFWLQHNWVWLCNLSIYTQTKFSYFHSSLKKFHTFLCFLLGSLNIRLFLKNAEIKKIDYS
jgi:hypothetical protein